MSSESEIPVCSYYINLDFRTDRNDYMLEQIKNSNWKFERISAVRLTKQPRELGIPLRANCKKHPHVASIFLSHKKALEAALSHKEDGVFLVVEDDVRFDFSSKPSPILPCNLPQCWEVAMVSPRFKTHVEGNDWRTVPTPLEFSAIAAAEFAKSHKVTGAHFCLFKNKEAVSKVLYKMHNPDVVYDIDYWYQEQTLCYLWHDDRVGTGKNLGASNHADPIEEVSST